MSYKLEISGQHLEVTDAIKELTRSKVEHMAKISDKITNIHITFHVDKHEQGASGQVHVPNKLIAAEASSGDLYKTIDLLIGKLETQLRKYKEKNSDHQS